ncbi:MAG: cation transporter [Streptococcaceae bacterium]|jgi:copper chaperone|nr:cation transporter [Streptococcaceae bacterium]
MEKTTLNIAGMTCQHCVAQVTEALEAVAGVQSAKVNLKKGQAVVKAEAIQPDTLTAAVAKAGYQVL